MEHLCNSCKHSKPMKLEPIVANGVTTVITGAVKCEVKYKHSMKVQDGCIVDCSQYTMMKRGRK